MNYVESHQLSDAPSEPSRGFFGIGFIECFDDPTADVSSLSTPIIFDIRSLGNSFLTAFPLRTTTPGRKGWIIIVAAILLLVLGNAAPISFLKIHHKSSENEQVFHDQRMQKVLGCTSKLSGMEISKDNNPIRCSVAEYFTHGVGKDFDVDNCDDIEKSSFPEACSL
jgi:hypothetical protein